MADAYWRYSDLRQPPQQQLQQQQPPPPQQQQIQQPPTIVGKRPRSDYDIPSGHQPPNYYAREDDRGPLRSVRDTDSIEASYERYLRGAPVPPYNGGQSARPISGVPSRPADDPRIEGMGGLEPGPAGKDRSLGSGRPEISLPPDASSTLFVEGLPSDCSRREVAHIFRPFVGYKEVRLVSKESRRPGGDPLVLCFVDFLSPAHSATAMDALHVWNLWIYVA
ncbi:RNA-binding protein 1-like isoform X2 [Mercurialis annua]|uniref:RNA-binding protein 1-like isoform X2 n=1 Tax=Mercurialis annua TaxID=3986 RepID=UPI00215F77AA|nr:RNA-binding protein 1-like isoform X2 [Mercurialis annua]